MVYIISDSLGETAELVVRAAASQFDSGQISMLRFPYVSEREQITCILDEASKVPSVVAYTLVRQPLRDFLLAEAQARRIPAVDVLGPMVEALASVTRVTPRMEPGLLHRLDEDYFRKMEAIEFAVKYDDGKDPRGLALADIVLIGVSRTSKTPVSMYLAHKHIKTANVPLVPEVSPPEDLFAVCRGKTVGLTISAEQLTQIRAERLKTMGLTTRANYADPKRILQELAFAERIMRELGCPVIDVTNRAVEETASKVLEIYSKGDRYAQ
ncbi:MAG: kinase/pyrophosphorylase [Clostridia bacterium]|nr:MAG: kinase/pyrophosphorylase [Clostridia bacterium]